MAKSTSAGERLYKETVLNAMGVRERRGTNRPSEQGEELENEGKANPDGRYVGLPPALESVQFQCPSCKAHFGNSPESLGQHIVRHEPFLNPKRLENPKQCKKCDRWLEFSGGEYNFHVRLCRGEKPL